MSGQVSGGGFRRRIYAGPMHFLRDLWRILRSMRAVLALSLPGGIAAGFRERIMLVVTGVNRCRHCAWGHEILAQRAGLSKVGNRQPAGAGSRRGRDGSRKLCRGRDCGLGVRDSTGPKATVRRPRRPEAGWKQPTVPAGSQGK
jgi:AhpD family alkylhydroperoxidase